MPPKGKRKYNFKARCEECSRAKCICPAPEPVPKPGPKGKKKKKNEDEGQDPLDRFLDHFERKFDEMEEKARIDKEELAGKIAAIGKAPAGPPAPPPPIPIPTPTPSPSPKDPDFIESITDNDDPYQDTDADERARQKLLGYLMGGKKKGSKKEIENKYPDVIALVPPRETRSQVRMENVSFPEFVGGFLEVLRSVEAKKTIYGTWFKHLQEIVGMAQAGEWENTRAWIMTVKARVDAGTLKLGDEREMARVTQTHVMRSVMNTKKSTPSATATSTSSYYGKRSYNDSNNFARPSKCRYVTVRDAKDAIKAPCDDWQKLDGCKNSDHHENMLHICAKCWDENVIFAHPKATCHVRKR